MATILQPQAALEQAVANLIQSSLGYSPSQCCRMHDGRPEPRCGQVFVAVWSPAGRESKSRTALDEYHKVFVTVTGRVSLPFDRKVQHRDDLESRINAIRALIHGDVWDNRVVNAANLLAGYRGSGTPGTQRPGFCQGLALQGIDDIEDVGGEWFAASKVSDRDYGITQTLRFGQCRRIQSLAAMT